MMGRVIWYDKMSGEGFVQRSDDGKLLYVHYSCIAGNNICKLPVDQPYTLKPTQLVYFTVYKNLYSERIDTLTF